MYNRNALLADLISFYSLIFLPFKQFRLYSYQLAVKKPNVQSIQVILMKIRFSFDGGELFVIELTVVQVGGCSFLSNA